MANDNKSYTSFRGQGKPTKRTSNAAVIEAFLAASEASASVVAGAPTKAAIVLDGDLFVPNEGAQSVLFIDGVADRTVHKHVRDAVAAGLLPKGVIPMPGRPEGSKNKAKPAVEATPVEAAPADAPVLDTPAPVEAAPVEATPA